MTLLKYLLILSVLPAAAVEPSTPTARGELDRAVPVPAGQAKPFALPAVQRGALANGIDLALQEVKRLPLVSVKIVLPYAGSLADPANKNGLGAFVAGMLDEGTATKDAVQFAEAVQDLGASVSASTGDRTTVVTVFATRDRIDAALGLAAEMLLQPAFRQADLERLQRRTVMGLRQAADSADALADGEAADAVYGDHPYAADVTEGSVTAITTADLAAFHALRYQPTDVTVAAAGDISLPDFEALVAKHFGGWAATTPPGQLPVMAPPLPEAETKPGQAPANPALAPIHLIDKPGMPQSQIRVARLAVPKGHRDEAAVKMMNFILGGNSITGRVGKNLREDKGWSYGAYSSVETRDAGGMLVVSAGVQADKTADSVRELLREIETLRTQKVSAEEFEAFRTLLLGSIVRSRQTVQNLSANLATVEAEGLPEEALLGGRDKILALTPEDVHSAAQRYLTREKLRVVVVGDAAQVRAPLEAIAPVLDVTPAARPEQG